MFIEEAKIKHADEFQRCLLELDVRAAIKLWRYAAPNSPAMNEREMLCMLHMARTASAKMPPRLKSYSESWLKERGYGSLANQHREIGHG